ncbi:MAG TPA: ABC transporter ATP-binding protein [Rhodocyclaceae bacterium]|nr:ABC transporter ATP-binding protein [Rhodocyclaceae bacterium]
MFADRVPSLAEQSGAGCAPLVLRGGSKSYGLRAVLGKIDLELQAGDYVAIMGESGVGKSTLLNLIAGLDRPDGGSIQVAGADLATLDDDGLARLRRKHLGFVFQAFHLLPYLSVAQNVALPLALNGSSRPEIDARVRELLAAVGLAGRMDDSPRQLSGGETQRVAIARALAHRPRLLLADEPTGNLDAVAGAGVLELLRRSVKEAGAAGILVTHSRAAAETTDRVFVLTGDSLTPL